MATTPAQPSRPERDTGRKVADRIRCGGLLQRPRQCMLRIRGLAWQPGEPCGVLSLFSEAAVPVSFLTIDVSEDDLMDMTFCFSTEQLGVVSSLTEQLKNLYRPHAVAVVENVTILTLYGPHFAEKHGLVSEIFATICSGSVRVHAINSSVNSISLVVDAAQTEAAGRALATRFAWPV